MSENVKNINKFFKLATKSDINKLKEEINLSEHLEKVLQMFYIQEKDINMIAYELGYSRGKIEADLRQIRKKISIQLNKP